MHVQEVIQRKEIQIFSMYRMHLISLIHPLPDLWPLHLLPTEVAAKNFI